jgi:hypothetical protein
MGGNQSLTINNSEDFMTDRFTLHYTSEPIQFAKLNSSLNSKGYVTDSDPDMATHSILEAATDERYQAVFSHYNPGYACNVIADAFCFREKDGNYLYGIYDKNQFAEKENLEKELKKNKIL